MQLINVMVADLKEKTNPRTDFSKVQELADSIERIGLIQPIVVRRFGPEIIVVDGACRLRALKKLEQKETQVIVIEAEGAEEAQLAANLVRSDLNVLERARGYLQLVTTMPARYNVASISKAFNTPKKTVERMLSVARRIDPKNDAELGKYVGHISLEDLEVIVQVPNTLQVELAKRAVEGNVRWNLSQIAKELDFGSDAVNTGALVAAGKAFLVKFSQGHEEVYTTDSKVYEKAKADFEADKKKKYGQEQQENKDRTARERKAKQDLDAKKKKSRDAARKMVKTAILKELKAKPSAKDLDAIGEAICTRYLNARAAKGLYEAFAVKESKGEAWNLTRRVWKDVLAPIVKTPAELASLEVLFSGFRQHDEKSFEEQIVARSKK